MTSSDQPVRGPVGMPAHLWELAKSDVRLSVPNRVRNAVANGLNAPEGVRRIAARVAVTGAAMGVPAAMIGLGGFLDTADTPVDLAGGEAPLDGLDGAPAMPGSYDGGSGPGGGHGGYGGPGGHGGPGGGSGPGGDGGSADGFASATTHGAGGDVQSGLGSTWHVQDPTGEPGDWLTVQMFQDVTVTETADGMFVVDAWQFIVIRDDDGNEYVFKEHYQVVVPDPPGQETDLIINERGFVHVIERPDGTFGVDTDFGIDVSFVADGDGRDEVTIGQEQHVRFTDTDGKQDEDVTVDLSEKATSTSDDEGDEATTTIGQDQVFDDGEKPPVPFGGGKKTTTTDPDDDADDTRDTRDAKEPKDPKDVTAGGRPDDAEHRDPYGGDGGVDPSSPFGEEPADRGAGTAPGAGAGSPSAPAGTGTAPAATAPAASAGGAASTARTVDAPLASAAVAAPAASVLTGEGPTVLEAPTGLGAPAGPELDAPPAGTEQTAAQKAATEPTGPEQAPDPDAPAAQEATAPEPFAGTAPPTGPAPFEPADPGTTAGTGEKDASGQGNAPSTPDQQPDTGDNTPTAGHDSQSDPTERVAGSPEPESAEHAGNHDGGTDTADHGTDDADHALVS